MMDKIDYEISPCNKDFGFWKARWSIGARSIFEGILPSWGYERPRDGEGRKIKKQDYTKLQTKIYEGNKRLSNILFWQCPRAS